MNSQYEVALRTVMLGTAACGDYPSIIEFIVFARPAPPRLRRPRGQPPCAGLTVTSWCFIRGWSLCLL